MQDRPGDDTAEAEPGEAGHPADLGGLDELDHLLVAHVPDRDLRRWIRDGGSSRKDLIVSVDVGPPPDLLLEDDSRGRSRLSGITAAPQDERRLGEAAGFVESLVGVTPVTLRAARAISTRLSADEVRDVVAQSWVDSVYLNRHLGGAAATDRTPGRDGG